MRSISIKRILILTGIAIIAVILVGFVLVQTSDSAEDLYKSVSNKMSSPRLNDLDSLSDDTYYYTKNFVSETGYESETVVQVVNGEVYKVKHTERPAPNRRNTRSSTTVQSAAEIRQAAGEALPLTHEQMITKCRSYLSRDPFANDIRMSTEEGRLQYCYYRQHSCRGDCIRSTGLGDDFGYGYYSEELEPETQ